MADFQVGDKVKVREDLTAGVRYNEYRCNEEMEELRGKICTIRNISNSSGVYNIVEEKSSWFWTDDMFEPVTENTKEDKTMNKFKVGDKVRVREKLKRGGLYFNSANTHSAAVTSEMARIAGQVVTIKTVNEWEYTLEECGYFWTDEMFESEPISSTSKSKENNNMNMRKVCYEIVDYKYDDQTGETYIKWDDKS